MKYTTLRNLIVVGILSQFLPDVNGMLGEATRSDFQIISSVPKTTGLEYPIPSDGKSTPKISGRQSPLLTHVPSLATSPLTFVPSPATSPFYMVKPSFVRLNPISRLRPEEEQEWAIGCIASLKTHGFELEMPANVGTSPIFSTFSGSRQTTLWNSRDRIPEIQSIEGGILYALDNCNIDIRCPRVRNFLDVYMGAMLNHENREKAIAEVVEHFGKNNAEAAIARDSKFLEEIDKQIKNVLLPQKDALLKAVDDAFLFFRTYVNKNEIDINTFTKSDNWVDVADEIMAALEENELPRAEEYGSTIYDMINNKLCGCSCCYNEHSMPTFALFFRSDLQKKFDSF